MSIGEKVKKIRKSKNLTQAQLAERLDIDPSYINKIENNAYRPTVILLKAIALELGCSIEDITECEREITA